MKWERLMESPWAWAVLAAANALPLLQAALWNSVPMLYLAPAAIVIGSGLNRRYANRFFGYLALEVLRIVCFVIGGIASIRLYYLRFGPDIETLMVGRLLTSIWCGLSGLAMVLGIVARVIKYMKAKG